MNTAKKMLVAVTALGVLGFVRAEAVDQVSGPAILAPANTGSHFASGISASYSFADIVNLPAGETQLLPAGDTVGRVRTSTFSELANVAESIPERLASADATASLLGEVSAMNGAFGDLSAVVVADDLFASGSGAAGPNTHARSLFSIADMPEPADWMTLLCGLVVVAFMVLRKSGPFAD